MSKLIGIDLGSSIIRMIAQNDAAIVRAPAAVALERGRGKVLYSGKEALSAADRLPGAIKLEYPLKRNEPETALTAEMMRAIISKEELGGIFNRPSFVAAMPHGASIEACGAVTDALLRAGASEVACVDAPLAAYFGCDLDPEGVGFLILLGSSICEIACVCRGSILSAVTTKDAGDALDDALDEYLRKTCGVACRRSELERLREEIGGVHPTAPQRSATAHGVALATGLPSSLELTTANLNEAYLAVMGRLLVAVSSLISELPSDISDEVSKNGITLCGGCAKLDGLPALVTELLGIKCTLAADPEDSVINGIGDMMAIPDYPFNFTK